MLPIDYETANARVSSNPRLRPIVLDALANSPAKSELKVKCAGYLDLSGWLINCYLDVGGGTPEEVQIKQYRKDAVKTLQKAGVLSTGIFSSILIRIIIVPFLEFLIRRWLFPCKT